MPAKNQNDQTTLKHFWGFVDYTYLDDGSLGMNK